MLWIRTFLSELHAWQWLGILVARLATFCARATRTQMRETLIATHIPFPAFNAVFVSAVEFVCGLLLVLGALTPLACALLGWIMVMAIATTAIRNIKASSAINWLSELLYLPEVLYLVILIWLFFSGPGWVSVDHLIFSQIGR
jgi:putative oxidoreductase